MPLYPSERHVTPSSPAWDPARARRWLSTWSAAALDVWQEGGHWPMHPRDIEPDEPTDPLHCLYLGSTGVWLALARVARAGLCTLPLPLAELYARIAADYPQKPDLGKRCPSWFLGESGILTAQWLARRDDAVAERLAAVVHDNRDNPTREALWGAPGTMLAALFLHEATGEARWVDLFRDSADALWSSWTHDATTDTWLWEQDLYGEKCRYLGAGHGWAGNLYPLWRGHALLRPEQRTELRDRTLRGLAALARVDGELANWPTLLGREDHLLVQWCHGAPGVITSLRHADLPEALPLLSKFANLIVQAGPLKKGPALCHGTDGNGVALLEIHRRTGDRQWLDQARHLAMTAITQSEHTFKEYGQWRHSLWTGDAGLACTLLDCLDGTARGMPGLDYF